MAFLFTVMPKNKHADLMLLYAEQAQICEQPFLEWQFKSSDKAPWKDLNRHPSWGENTEYRLRAMYEIVNGTKINKGVSIVRVGELYYTADPGHKELVKCQRFTIEDLEYFDMIVSSGLVFTNRDDAIMKSRMMLVTQST